MIRRAAAAAAALACLLGGQLVLAGPASAHAELVSSTPSDGERLEQSPAEVVLRFTESVSLVDDGIQLLDSATGARVETADPVADGGVVRFSLTDDLPPGSYLVNWRVVSADSHPVAGAFSFGVGTEPVAAPSPPPDPGPPWTVQVARGLGYVGFSLLAGGLALAGWCWRPGRRDPRVVRLLVTGLLLAAAATTLGFLVQGPYVSGVSMGRLLEPTLMSQVAATEFGRWMLVRFGLYVVLVVLLATGALTRSAAALGVGGALAAALAVTFSGTGHAAASGNVGDRVVDTVHVLAAGTWVGGLLVLAVLSMTSGPQPQIEAFVRFSRLALAAVLVVVGSGSLNALLRLDEPGQLWETRYGVVLAVKVLLVVAVVVAAAFSRRRVRAAGTPWRNVQVESVGVVAVLALTSVLTLTPPPSSAGDGTDPSALAPASTTVTMELEDGRRALLVVEGLTTAGSHLDLSVLEPDGSTAATRSVTLKATLAARDLGPLEVRLVRFGDGWSGNAVLPVPGEWELVLTVEYLDRDAVVTAGRLTVG